MDVQFWKNYDSAEEQLYKDSNDETEAEIANFLGFDEDI